MEEACIVVPTNFRFVRLKFSYSVLREQHKYLYLLFRALLININICPTRCNTKQSIYYSVSSLYMFPVSTHH